jgi:hypothetical protein
MRLKSYKMILIPQLLTLKLSEETFDNIIDISLASRPE